MSEITNVLNKDNQQINNVDISKIFIGENHYDKAPYTNSTYDTVELSAGRLLGRVAATQQVIPLVSTATDGSQYPVGILARNYKVLSGDVVDLTYCKAGYVAKEKVILDAGDEMTTIISSRSIQDRIAADTVGIVLFETDEQTKFDNQ